jgi:hypothetical protein
VFPARHLAQGDKRHAACAIAIAGIQLMRHFMDYQIETGSIEGVLNIQPV